MLILVPNDKRRRIAVEWRTRMNAKFTVDGRLVGFGNCNIKRSFTCLHAFHALMRQVTKKCQVK